MSHIEATLAQRGERYGTFEDNAAIAQGVKDQMKCSPRWDELDSDQKEALEVIASKISRILTGDPNYRDNWHDIAGYATLVDKRLGENEAALAAAQEDSKKVRGRAR